MRILVLGAGAIGGYYGGRLAEGGGSVDFRVERHDVRSPLTVDCDGSHRRQRQSPCRQRMY